MKNKFFVVLLTFILLFSFALPCFALNHSTYNDIAQNNSTVQNLLSFAMNYNTFKESDYVVYCNAQNSYFIVWGELIVSSNRVVSNEDIFYVSYIRGTDNQYHYTYSEDSSFILNVNDVVVSNIDGIGMQSQIYEEFDYRQNFYDFSVVVLVLLFVILLFKVRKG